MNSKKNHQALLTAVCHCLPPFQSPPSTIKSRVSQTRLFTEASSVAEHTSGFVHKKSLIHAGRSSDRRGCAARRGRCWVYTLKTHEGNQDTEYSISRAHVRTWPLPFQTQSKTLLEVRDHVPRRFASQPHVLTGLESRGVKNQHWAKTVGISERTAQRKPIT